MITMARSVFRFESSEKKDSMLIMLSGLSVLWHNPLSTFQSHAVLSHNADAISWPSGEKYIVVTSSKWPSSILQQDFVPTSQRRTVLSFNVDATNQPSVEKTIALRYFGWSSSRLQQNLVPTSQSRTMLSQQVNATSWPSDNKATVMTGNEWPSNVYIKTFKSFYAFGNLLTHIVIQSLNIVRIILIFEAKIRAEE